MIDYAQANFFLSLIEMNTVSECQNDLNSLKPCISVVSIERQISYLSLRFVISTRNELAYICVVFCFAF